MSTTNTAGFIVYQAGYAIFGTGDTLDAAMDDAAQWTDAEDFEAEPGRASGGINGQMYYLPATAALIAQVKRDGGQIRFDITNGVADVAHA